MAAGHNPNKRRKNNKPKVFATRNDPKQQQQINDVDEDGLIDLPDSILHDILSYLDAKTILGTSVLSRTWRCFVEPYSLNFNAKSFPDDDDGSSFRNHVTETLSRRNRPSASPAVRSITFEFGTNKKNTTSETSSFDMVMQHAGHQDDQGNQLERLSVTHDKGKLRDIAASIAACRGSRSLETLVLKSLILDRDKELGNCLGLWSLTTLELHRCVMFNVGPAGRPCQYSYPLDELPLGLKRLKMVDCTSSGPLRVSAPRLEELEIRSLLCKRVDKLFAPKLKSFSLWCSVLDLEKLPSWLDFPCLDHASIRLWCDDPCRLDHDCATLDDVSRAYLTLLLGFQNVKSFVLGFDKLPNGEPWKERHFLFREMNDCPFARLETVRIQYPQEPISIPHHVIRYFFGANCEFDIEQTKDGEITLSKIK